MSITQTTGTQSYPSPDDCQTFTEGKGLESINFDERPFDDAWEKFEWRLVKMMEAALPLNVYADSTTTVKVLAGDYLWHGTKKTYAGSTAINPADNDITYIWMTPANTVSSGIDGSGWPATEHLKIAEVTTDANGLITNITSKLTAISLQGHGGAGTDGITTGQVHCKTITSAALEALLNTTENDLFPIAAGDIILAVKLFVETPAGGACTVTIGTDVDVDGTTADPDSLLKAGDANTAGIYSSDDVAKTFQGDDLKSGAFVADDAGYITITSSTDQSASAFVGRAVLLYIPA